MTTTLKTYPKYKESTIEWVKNIPHDWDTKPLRYCCMENLQKNTTLSNTNILSLSYGNIILKDTGGNFGLVPESYSSYQVLDLGDIVMRLTDLQNDHVSLRTGLVKNKGIITSAYLGLKIRQDRLDSRFLHWLLHSYDLQKVFYGMGGGIRQTVGYNDLKWLPILIPNTETQKNIADFLDKKTKVIDELVAKKEKLIELLREKRAALITQAVTKGLDPKAKMKPSSIDWLGDIPREWTLVKFGYIYKSSMGETILKNDLISGGVIPVFSATENVVIFGYVNKSRILLKNGDLIIPARGNSIGNVKIVRQDCTTTQTTIYCKKIMKRDVYSDYYRYLLLGLKDVYFFFDRTAIPQITVEQVRNNLILIPPFNLQNEIANFLDLEAGKLESAVNIINIQINHLREYRSSLIYSAVTGKIKV